MWSSQTDNPVQYEHGVIMGSSLYLFCDTVPPKGDYILIWPLAEGSDPSEVCLFTIPLVSIYI